jgi:PAS domain S-box-containing protein
MGLAVSGYRVNQVIHESDTSLVYRGSREADHQPVILKILKQPYPTPEETAWFRREYELLKNLNLAGVINVYSLKTGQNHLVMVLEDFGGQDLRYFIKTHPLNLAEFLPLAIQLADILSQVHQQHIIHKDINPSNVVLNPVTRQVKLIDFGIATVLSRENPTLRNPNVLEGTLAYISPEQTGRMNRAIDYRTDFYSLGVTFYELLTGQLPFAAADALEMIHAHIAKYPTPPHELKPDLPQPLSQIVLKLMTKNAEDRYQSAYGLKADLEECWRQWQLQSWVEPFPLGRADVSSSLQIPQKLYGREAEIEQLLAAFERVSQGASELMLVSGYAGIGKSVLVQEIYKPITRQRGYFIAGKFDQFQRSVPYASLVQAFRTLMRQLLTESAAQVSAWQQKLLAALGPNGQVIIEVIPEVELIIGPQPETPKLAPKEAQNRFNLVFQNFIQVFTQAEHPLALFLDDLQWADAASLALLQLLMIASNSHHLFVIGAYRDNETTPTHPLLDTLAAIQKAGGVVNQIALKPLDLPTVNQFITDALSCLAETAAPLAELLMTKTHGNPFFVNEFLKSLYAEGLLWFVPPQNGRVGGWNWELAQIQARRMADNVVELMAAKVQQLKQPTQQVLKLAACIGNQFDLKTLAIVYEKSRPETAAGLWEALVEGLVLPLDESYKLMELEVEGLAEKLSVEYKFAHDRIRQAIYSLIPVADKQVAHRRIGQLLLQNIPPEGQEQRIFDITNHLNLAQSLISEQAERTTLARLNLQAGRKAKASVAYQPALYYFQMGLGLLGERAWEQHYDLSLALHTEAAEAAYLTGNLEQMTNLVQTVLQRAQNSLDKVPAYEINFQAHFAENNIMEIIDVGRQVLELLGLSFPEKPTQADVVRALAETKQVLADFQTRTGQSIAGLLELPAMTDPYKLASVGVIANVAAAAYGVFPETYQFYVATAPQLSIQYGNAPVSARSYVAYGIVLCGVAGDIETGYQFGKLALNLVDRLKAKAIHPIVSYLFNGLIAHWKVHLRETLAPLLAGYQSGLETGTLQFAALCTLQYVENAFWSGWNLAELEQEIAKYNRAMTQLNQSFVLNWNLQYHQTVLNLLGQAPDPCRLSGASYDEEKMQALHREMDDESGLGYLYLSKLTLCYLFQAYPQAVENAAFTEQHLAGLLGRINLPIFHFYDSLARLALFSEVSQAEQEHTLQKVAVNQEKLKSWAQHAPMNYQHKYYLVEAELARVSGHPLEAREYYDQAILLARTYNYLNEEALANELAAQFYLARGHSHVAHHYLADAYSAYMRWGAVAKLKQLENRYPHLAPTSPMTATITDTVKSRQDTQPTLHASRRGLAGALDLSSVLKASQTISGEIMLDKLLDRLMKIVIENAGAQRGCFILSKAGEWVIEAEGAVEAAEVALLQATPIEQVANLPQTIINYVARTQESVVLNDARRSEQYAADDYIIRHQPKSVMCMPLLNQGKLTGILYLENNLTTDAFTPDRLEVLSLLSAQMAISIENAALYANLGQSEKKYRTLFEDSRDAIYIVTRDGRFLDVNQAALDMLGYTREEMLLLNAQELYANPADRAKFQAAIEQTGSVRDFEIKFRKKDGTVLDCLSTSTIRQAEDGTILGYQGVIRDITERKQAERERAQLLAIQSELDVAHNIQSSLLPSPSPEWPELDVVCYNMPAREVGGDFYTYHLVEPASPSNPQPLTYIVAVGDVSGKGMPAALLMSISLASLEASLNQDLRPGELMTYLDRVLDRYTKDTYQNCALCFAEISSKNSEEKKAFSIVNAGCVTPIIRRANGVVEWVDALGVPLGTGLGAEVGYQEITLDLAKGDLMILTSDGVVEAHNLARDMFGFERLEQAVLAGPTTNAQAMLTHLRQDLARFTGDAAQNDDVTIVVIRV